LGGGFGLPEHEQFRKWKHARYAVSVAFIALPFTQTVSQIDWLQFDALAVNAVPASSVETAPGVQDAASNANAVRIRFTDCIVQSNRPHTFARGKPG
jgi:hypothetical protein